MLRKDIKLMPYHTHSASAKALAEVLRIKRIRVPNTRYVPTEDSVIINWGRRDHPFYDDATFLNYPVSVRNCSNKHAFFETVKDFASIPEFTTSKDLALEWVLAGSRVFGRDVRGYGGGDIVDMSAEDLETKVEKFLSKQLFTKYIKKRHEFRVHIAFGKVIDIQQKKIRVTDDMGEPLKEFNPRIRNLANGYVFARNDVNTPAIVPVEALNAYNATGLDFGAFDVIYNEKYDRAYVLEVNTAPGLMGTTLEKYTEAFAERLDIGG